MRGRGSSFSLSPHFAGRGLGCSSAFSRHRPRKCLDRALADSVRSPWVRYDHVISRIPVAVLLDAAVKAVSVINICLCELNPAISRNFHGIGVSTRQLLVRLDFARRQAACAHSNHLVVVHFGGDPLVTDFSDVLCSILMELGPKKVVTVVVMGIFGKRESGGH